MLKFIATHEMRSHFLKKDSSFNCGKIGEKGAGVKLLFNNSSRAVSFPTENIASSYESDIAGHKITLIGQVDGSRRPLIQRTKLLKSKLIAQNFQSYLSYIIYLSLESCQCVS